MAAIDRTLLVVPRSEVVLDYLKDFNHAQEWDPGTKKCTRNGSGPIRVSASWHTEYQLAGKTTALTHTLAELTAELVVFVAENDIVRIRKTISVAPAEAGSQIRYHADLEFYGAAESVSSDAKFDLEQVGDETAKQLTDALNALASPELNLSGGETLTLRFSQHLPTR